jgi:ATP-dependent protease ClpP protease subunit
MYNLFFLTLFLFSSFVSSKEIFLDTNNTLLIRGEINEKLATQFIYELNQKPKKKNLYVYLDTNGGSVDAGNKIVNEIQKYNLSCIAQKAISMGFVILQSCKKRNILPLATLMQHQMSYGIINEKAKIESYVEYIKQIGNELTLMQAKKIGISPKKFNEKIYNDWWSFGKTAIENNCADEIVDVKCSTKLTNATYEYDNNLYVYTFSKCPLVNGYIDKKVKDNKGDFFFFM